MVEIVILYQLHGAGAPLGPLGQLTLPKQSGTERKQLVDTGHAAVASIKAFLAAALQVSHCCWSNVGLDGSQKP